MKKSLFLLPLLAGLALTGCGGDDGEGSSLEITYDLIQDALDEVGAEGDGYDKLTMIEELDGYSVSFNDIRTNRLNSSSVPKWKTPDDEEVQVIQFKSASKGEPSLTIQDIKPSTVVITYWTSYSVAVGNFSVKFDDTKCKGKKGTTEETEYYSVEELDGGETKNHEVVKCALTYTVNAEEAGELVIAGAGQGARYVESIVIE